MTKDTKFLLAWITIHTGYFVYFLPGFHWYTWVGGILGPALSWIVLGVMFQKPKR